MDITGFPYKNNINNHRNDFVLLKQDAAFKKQIRIKVSLTDLCNEVYENIDSDI